MTPSPRIYNQARKPSLLLVVHDMLNTHTNTHIHTFTKHIEKRQIHMHISKHTHAYMIGRYSILYIQRKKLYKTIVHKK